MASKHTCIFANEHHAAAKTGAEAVDIQSVKAGTRWQDGDGGEKHRGHRPDGERAIGESDPDACGTGGTVKKGQIEIQGVKREEVARIFTEVNFQPVSWVVNFFVWVFLYGGINSPMIPRNSLLRATIKLRQYYHFDRK